MVKPGARRAPSLPNFVDATPMHCAVHALCRLCVTRSRVGTHRSGAQYPRDALSKGRNIQELSVRDTSVGDTSTLHPWMVGWVWCRLAMVVRLSTALIRFCRRTASCGTFRANTTPETHALQIDCPGSRNYHIAGKAIAVALKCISLF